MVAALVATLGFAMVDWLDSGRVKTFTSTLAQLPFIYLFVLFCTAVLAFPLYIILRRLSLATLWSAGAAGFLLPALGFAGLALVARGMPIIGPISLPIFRLSLFCVAGAAAGLAFWPIAEGVARPNTSLRPTSER